MSATAPHHDVPCEVAPGSFDDLVADAAEVTRHLRRVSAPHPGSRAEVPGPRRVLVIPERARRVVAGLDRYGD